MEDRYAEIEVIVFPKVLDSCSAFLLQGAVIAVYGEISMREEEQPKLLALRITESPGLCICASHRQQRMIFFTVELGTWSRYSTVCSLVFFMTATQKNI